jgi:hypothetical protein
VNTFRRDLKLSTLGDLDRLLGLVTGLGLGVLDLLNNVVALEDLAKNDVSAVQPPVNGNPLAPVRYEDLLAMTGERGTYEVMTVVMKNWEPLVSLPALAMDKTPFLVCFSLKFSSANLLP